MIKTKIISTLGPASTTHAILRKMFIKGLDIARLNFSHGSHEEHIKRILLIRKLNKKMRRDIKIMQDLEGYRIRIGKLEKPVRLRKNSKIYLLQGETSGPGDGIPFDYKGPLSKLPKGTLIYVDDGKIALRTISVEKDRLKVRVLVSGEITQHKGVNIPSLRINFGSITTKDKKDLKVALKYKLDYVAQSFVSKADDIKVLKKLIRPKHPDCNIIAKIENQEALLNIDDIIEESDGIMVAREDLGISVPIYKVPFIQKDIIKRCHLKNKPVIVATQMLDSMTEQPLPTRAEVGDVANAILDGATDLLLSQETAIGLYPTKVVEMMNKIIKYTEDYQAGVFKHTYIM